jgi:hypothetical protein
MSVGFPLNFERVENEFSKLVVVDPSCWSKVKKHSNTVPRLLVIQLK